MTKEQEKWFKALKTVTDINVLIRTLDLTPQTQAEFWQKLLALLKSEETPIHWTDSDKGGPDDIQDEDIRTLFGFIMQEADLQDVTVPGPDPEPICSVLYTRIKELINDGDDSFWNESLYKLIEFFVNNIVNTENKTLIPLDGEEHSITVDTLKNADAGNNFPEDRGETTQWVIPWWNVDNQNYDEVRKCDEVLDILVNCKKMQYTNRPYSEGDSYLKKWIRLLMPQYGRRVEVEDLDRNFWVIAQTIAAISAYLFDEDSPLPKMFEGLLRETTEIWENIIYLWTEIAAISQDGDNKVQVITLPIQTRTNEHGRQYDYFDTDVSADWYSYAPDEDGYITITRGEHFDEEVEKRLDYLTEQYNGEDLCVLPYIRLNNYKHNYYAGEWYPGIYLYDSKQKSWTSYKIKEAPSDVNPELERYLGTSSPPSEIVSKYCYITLEGLTDEEAKQEDRIYEVYRNEELYTSDVEKKLIKSEGVYQMRLKFPEGVLQIGDVIRVDTKNTTDVFLSATLEKEFCSDHSSDPNRSMGRYYTGNDPRYQGTSIAYRYTSFENPAHDQAYFTKNELPDWLNELFCKLIDEDETHAWFTKWASYKMDDGYIKQFLENQTFNLLRFGEIAKLNFEIYAKFTEDEEWEDFSDYILQTGPQIWIGAFGITSTYLGYFKEPTHSYYNGIMFYGLSTEDYDRYEWTEKQIDILNGGPPMSGPWLYQDKPIIWKIIVKKTEPEPKVVKSGTVEITGLTNGFIIDESIYKSWKNKEEAYRRTCYLGSYLAEDRYEIPDTDYEIIQIEDEDTGEIGHYFKYKEPLTTTVDFTVINLNPTKTFDVRELVISPYYDTSWESFGEKEKRYGTKMFASKQQNGRLLWSYPFSKLPQTATAAERVLMYGALRVEPIISIEKTPKSIDIKRITLRVTDPSSETILNKIRLLGEFEMITGETEQADKTIKYFRYEEKDVEKPDGVEEKKLAYKTVELDKDGYYMGEVPTWKGKTMSEYKSDNQFNAISHVIKIGSYLRSDCSSFETARMSDGTHTLMRGNVTSRNGHSISLKFWLNDWTKYLPEKDQVGQSTLDLCFSEKPTEVSCVNVTHSFLAKEGLKAVKNYLIKTNNLSQPCYVATVIGLTPWQNGENLLYWDVGALCHIYHYIPSVFSLEKPPTDDSYNEAYDIAPYEIDGESGIMEIDIAPNIKQEVGKIISCNLIKKYDSFFDGWGMSNGDIYVNSPGKWRQFQIVCGTDEKCICVIINGGDPMDDGEISYDVKFSKTFTGEVNYYDNRWAQQKHVDVFDKGAQVGYAPGITIGETGYSQDQGEAGKGNIAACTSAGIQITARTNQAKNIHDTGFMSIPNGKIDFMGTINPETGEETGIPSGTTESAIADGLSRPSWKYT